MEHFCCGLPIWQSTLPVGCRCVLQGSRAVVMSSRTDEDWFSTRYVSLNSICFLDDVTSHPWFLITYLPRSLRVQFVLPFFAFEFRLTLRSCALLLQHYSMYLCCKGSESRLPNVLGICAFQLLRIYYRQLSSTCPKRVKRCLPILTSHIFWKCCVSPRLYSCQQWHIDFT
jgi:hypothetical protein